MSQNHWSQLRELRDLQERMNRFFHDVRGREVPSEGEWNQESEWTPPADIYEDGGEIILKMDLPEVDQRAIRVTVDGNRLVISGDRPFNPELNRDSFVRIERPHGHFSRWFALPDNVDPERIEASSEAGVLKVKLPRRDNEKRARTINIEVK
jgi:HSP20 family protein